MITFIFKLVFAGFIGLLPLGLYVYAYSLLTSGSKGPWEKQEQGVSSFWDWVNLIILIGVLGGGFYMFVKIMVTPLD
ncbi:hypothetical protein ACFFGV_18150 [Pontibacillus salicampi]|uniref:Cardiolipin synthase N-terminal domain-containing protein n=1 Tax=Pontibacillus salicampi TaxID=1449801 RepID=A0ABV6LSX5_9BACI